MLLIIHSPLLGPPALLSHITAATSDFPRPVHQSYGHLQRSLGAALSGSARRFLCSVILRSVSESTPLHSQSRNRHALIPKHEMQRKLSTATCVFKSCAAQHQVSQKPASLRHQSNSSSGPSHPIVQTSAQQFIPSIWGLLLFLF